MQLICCQWDVAWREPKANFDRVEALLNRVAVEPGALVLLPEMFATGYAVREPEVPDEAGDATGLFLRNLARERRVNVVGGMARNSGGGRAENVARAVAPDGTILVDYVKLHPFSLAGEHFLYEAGRQLVWFEWQGHRVTPLVCYDLRFPEVFRGCALAGVELFVVLANWPTARIDHWCTLLRARAIENQAFVVGLNRIGRDPNTVYPGRSMVIGPRGEVIADAGGDPTALSVEIDLALAARWRAEFPALRDARSDVLRGELHGVR
jgi:omega-amidase